MTMIAPPLKGKPLAVAAALARIYAQRTDSTETRMLNAGDALRQLAHLANYILARCPRINAAQSIQGALANAVGADYNPQWVFRLLDRASNGRTRMLHLLSVPRTAAPGGAGGSEEAFRYGSGGSEDTGPLLTGLTVASSASYPADLRHHAITHERGAVTDALEEIGITTIAGFTLCGLVVQDMPLTLLDTTLHDFASVQGFQSGDKCTALYVERLRAAVQTARENYLPMLGWWSANDVLGDNTPSGSDETGFEITATTLTNILDGSSTSRTAITPGVACHVQHAGHGPPSTEAGKRVLVIPRFYAATDDGDGAVVSFEGSATFSSNTDAVAVSGSSATAYAGSGFYLDASIADDDTTTARNKIDISAKVNTSGSVYVYGWTFEMEHI